MRNKVQGLRTCIYTVADLMAAKEWYSRVFETVPYFDERFYVGFNIAGYELGLMPEVTATQKSDNVLTYWGTEHIESVYKKFISAGASEHEAPKNVGGDIVVASVKDPWNNVIGFIFNPSFSLEDPPMH